MATLNLGRLKPVFRSGWNNSTAYNVDDIVVRNNQSYISIQAGTNQDPATATAYWTLMAAKGSDGTDVGATLSNKEIAFKTNAGAVDGIPIGNAGEFLKVNSGATGYEFGAVSSDFVKINTGTFSSASTVNIDGATNWGTYSDYKFHHLILNFDVVGNTYSHILIRQLNSGTAQTGGIYSWSLVRAPTHSASVSVNIAEGDSKIQISGDYFRGNNNAHHSVKFDIANLLKTADNKDYMQITGMSAQVNQDGDQRLHGTSFFGNTHSNNSSNTGRTGIQFSTSHGQITGNYITYGVKG